MQHLNGLIYRGKALMVNSLNEDQLVFDDMLRQFAHQEPFSFVHIIICELQERIRFEFHFYQVHYSPSTIAVPLENGSEVSSGDRVDDLNGGRQYHHSTSFQQQPSGYDAFRGKSIIDLEIAKNKQSIWSDVELHDMKNFEL